MHGVRSGDLLLPHIEFGADARRVRAEPDRQPRCHPEIGRATRSGGDSSRAGRGHACRRRPDLCLSFRGVPDGG
nr:MAG TPA: hypothetical protein [Caudoviricetes sp.]